MDDDDDSMDDDDDDDALGNFFSRSIVSQSSLARASERECENARTRARAR